MNQSDQCNGPCEEGSELRNLWPHSSRLRDVWTSFRQPALRQKKVEASLEFISFPFIIRHAADGDWWWVAKSLKVCHLSTSTLKENIISQHFPTLPSGVKYLLDYHWSWKWKRQRRNGRNCKKKALPLPEVSSSCCPPERRVVLPSNLF